MSCGIVGNVPVSRRPSNQTRSYIVLRTIHTTQFTQLVYVQRTVESQFAYISAWMYVYHTSDPFARTFIRGGSQKAQTLTEEFYFRRHVNPIFQSVYFLLVIFRLKNKISFNDFYMQTNEKKNNSLNFEQKRYFNEMLVL